MLQDFTVFGGSLSSAHAKKICKVGHDIIWLEMNLQLEDSHFVTSIHFLCSFYLEAFISSIHFHKGFIINNKWFEPRGDIWWHRVFVQLGVVLRGTVVGSGDWCFDNLVSRSHYQSVKHYSFSLCYNRFPSIVARNCCTIQQLFLTTFTPNTTM